MLIEEALVAKLLSMDAVRAITTTIRPYMLLETDRPDQTPAILITIDDEDFDTQNISGGCDLVTAKVTISAIFRRNAEARALAEAIRNNGTNPGTGLQGCAERSLALPFDAMLERRKPGYVLNEDGSDSGLVTVDSFFTVKYYETY